MCLSGHILISKMRASFSAFVEFFPAVTLNLGSCRIVELVKGVTRHPLVDLIVTVQYLGLRSWRHSLDGDLPVPAVKS
jgi:hypothetical protein